MSFVFVASLLHVHAKHVAEQRVQGQHAWLLLVVLLHVQLFQVVHLVNLLHFLHLSLQLLQLLLVKVKTSTAHVETGVVADK